ncbi:MAG: hypothetical protein HY332_21815 [Chloroflexi bacterium]|nr:hypothetical protein [Chloroflexota bacterium]
MSTELSAEPAERGTDGVAGPATPPGADQLVPTSNGQVTTGQTSKVGNEYHFVTEWWVEGTVEEVADIIGDPVGLPRWWPSVYLDVQEFKPGDAHNVGREIALYTKGWLPYTLRWCFRVVENRHPYGFTIEAWGDFVGRGIWTFEQAGPLVHVTYDWQIRADKPLLRRLSFLLKPVFEANHRWAMAKGEESLRLELARRRAATPEARAAIPAPPGPTTTSPLPLAFATLAALALAAGAGYAVLYLIRRRLRRGRPRQYQQEHQEQQPARQTRQTRRFTFDPDRIAHFEAAGWRAYYDRNWPKLFGLIARLSREQFHMPFPESLLGAYYIARAAAAWAPQRHDAQRGQRYYEQFYRLARRYSGLTFDPVRVAELELRYNDVHRRLVGQPDKREFVQTMTDLHSATFGIPARLARRSAELRVRAANVVDQITSRQSRDVEADWRRLEDYLRACYRSIRQARRAALPAT